MTGKSLVSTDRAAASSPPPVPPRAPVSEPRDANILHLNGFDALRLAAALMVLASHMYSICGLEEPGIAPSFTLGGVGLAIFFSVSGFLVARSWQNDPHPLRFAGRRLWRVMPPLILVVLLSILALGPLVGSEPNDAYFHNPSTWEYLRNLIAQPDYVLPGVFGPPHPVDAVNGSLWTFPILLLMYGLVAVFGLIKFMRRRIMVILIALAFTASSILYRRLSPEPYIFLSTDLQHVLDLGAYFWSGAAFYLTRQKMNYTAPRIITLCAVSAMLVTSPYLVTWSVLAIPYLVVAFGTHQDRLFYIPRWLGDLSCGIYLFAFPVQQLVWHFYHDEMDVIDMMVVSAFASAVLAWFSWHLVEKRILRRVSTAGASR